MTDNKNTAQQTAAPSKEEQLKLQEKETELRKQEAIINRYETAMQVTTAFMNPDVWTQMRTMAKIFFESRALPKCIQNEAQAIMVMQAGFESGMKPVESLQSLYIVNGSITIWGKATGRRLKEHGWKIRYENEVENVSCTAVVTKGDEEYKETFTYKMALDSGYTKSRAGEFKVGWVEGANRKLKLRYNSLSMLIKSYIPEVLGAAEDIAEVAEDFIIPDKQKEDTNTTEEKEPVKKVVNVANLSNLSERIAQSREKRDQRVSEQTVQVSKEEIDKVQNVSREIKLDNIVPLDKQGAVEGVQIQ